MFELSVPGYKTLRLKNLVLDYNGTIAFNGDLIAGVKNQLSALSSMFSIFVITADTFGTVTKQVDSIARVKILTSGDHRAEKRQFIDQLGAESVVAMGNGRNDVAMIKGASLGIAVGQGEGVAVEAILAADILCNDIAVALDLFQFPDRLKATLRA